jgi:Domain of unknown function (DUF4136)
MYRSSSPFSSGRLAVALSAGFLLTACSTVTYRADYDRDVEFVAFKTYDWMLPTEAEQREMSRISPFLERRLTRAIDSELVARGFVKNTDGHPDFWISAYPVLAEEGDSVQATTYGVPAPSPGVGVSVGFSVGAPFGYGFYPYPYGYAPVTPFNPYFGYPGYGWYPGFGVGLYSFGGYGSSPSGVGYGYPIAASANGYAPGTIAVDVTDASTDVLVWRGWADGALYEGVSPEELPEFINEVVSKIMRGFPPVRKEP